MKKVLSYILAYIMCLSLFVPCVSAQGTYTLTQDAPLTIEFEDNIPAGKEAYLLESADASGGKLVGSGWGGTDFNSMTIPFTVTEAGYYHVEFVESRGIAGDGFSRIDGSIFAEDNTTLVHGFNMNFYPQKDTDFVEKEYQVTTSTGWSGGFGNTMIKQKYTDLYLEEGTYNVHFYIHAVADHTNFALDYIKFTPSVPEEEERYELTMSEALTVEIEDDIPRGREAYVYNSVDASGGKFVGSGWGAADFNKITIPLTIKEAGSYNIEFVQSKFYAGDGYSRIDTYLADADGAMVHAFNGNHAPNVDPNFVEKEYQITNLGGFGNLMIKQKYTDVELEEGDVNICFDIHLVGDHTNFALDYIKFTPRTAAKLESIKIGGEEFAENASYHRSSDVIVLDYDNELDTNVVPEIAFEEAGGDNISFVCDYSEDKDKLVIKLTESLQYGKNYKLAVSGLIDTLKFKLAAKTVTFAVQATDETTLYTDSVVIDSFTIKKGIANIKGSIKSSQNVGIAGRGIKWYITLPGQEKILVKENVVSGEDGAFDLSYTLSDDSVQGTVISKLQSDYAEDATKEVYYVSDTYMLPILQSLATASDWQSVKDIIDTNKTILGVNPTRDLAGLDLEDYYDQWIGAEITSIDEFRSFYDAMIALEMINQATNAYRVKVLLTTESITELLEIDGGKISALGDAKEELFAAIFDLERIRGKEAFQMAFNECFNALLMEKEGFSEITLSLKDTAAKQGEEVSLAVESADEIESIKKITLYVTFAGCLETGAGDISFETALGDYEIELTENKAVIEITAEEPCEGKEIGVLRFVSDDTGEGSVTLRGAAACETATEYDASLNINEGTAKVTISAQRKQSIGGGGYFGGGGTSASKGEVLIPQVAEKKKTPESKEIFVDLEEASWAKDYILGLYNKQAIGRNEEGKFYPVRNITRAEFIKIVVLANDIVRGSLVEVNFEDVKPEDWYYQYVEAAVRVGLILGNESGKFCPNDYITREDICVILGRLSGVNESVNEAPFADDGEISDYAKASVYTMKQRGIVNGKGDGLFAPKANATRAEAAKIIFGVSK